MFNPSRLSLARKRRGVNKIRLSKSTGLSLRSISAYENGEKVPSDETVEKIAVALSFPAEFFSGVDVEVPDPTTASFRSMARMSAAQRDAALGAGGLSFLLYDWMEAQFELPKTDLLDLREEETEAAAMALRQH